MAIPKFHDEKLALLPQKFFLALGHLQYAHTTLEVTLVCHIKNLMLAAYDPKEHRQLMDSVDAVLGGMRMDVAKETLKRVIRVMGAPKDVTDYVNDLFAHLSDVTYFRNRLTHYHTGRWFRKAGKFVNTDIEIAKEPSKAVTFEFTHDALDAARHDLHAISHYLDQALPPLGEAYVLEPPAWQYKPAMLIPLGSAIPAYWRMVSSPGSNIAGVTSIRGCACFVAYLLAVFRQAT